VTDEEHKHQKPDERHYGEKDRVVPNELKWKEKKNNPDFLMGMMTRQQLGEGGMGVLQEIVDSPDPSEMTVIKQTKGVMDSSPFTLAREKKLTHEAGKHAASALPAVVDPDENTERIIMRNDTGVDLEHMLAKLRQQDLSVRLVAALQIARAFQEFEKANMLHRDIKPANILITIQGKAKILDLGLAIKQEEEPPEAKERNIVGSPQYFSPEHITSGKHSKMDRHSLGGIFFQLLSTEETKPFLEEASPESSSATAFMLAARELTPETVKGVIRRKFIGQTPEMTTETTQAEKKETTGILQLLKAILQRMTPWGKPKEAKREEDHELRARIRLGALLEDMLSPDPDARPNPQEIIQDLMATLEILYGGPMPQEHIVNIQRTIGTLVQRKKDAHLYEESQEKKEEEVEKDSDVPTVRERKIVAPPKHDEDEDENKKPISPDLKKYPVPEAADYSSEWASLPDLDAPQFSSGQDEHAGAIIEKSNFDWKNPDDQDDIHNNPTVITRKKK